MTIREFGWVTNNSVYFAQLLLKLCILSGSLGLAGKSILSNSFTLYFSKPTIAIIAALSPHKLSSGKIGLSYFHYLLWKSLIPLFAATPPATTNEFYFSTYFLNSSKAIFVFIYKISSIVFWENTDQIFLVQF